MILIALHGPIGSGKSTAAEYIACELAKSQSVMLASLAATLKVHAGKIGWDGAKDKRGRRFLQKLGQTGREYDARLWIDKWLDGVIAADFDVVVTDDLRYENEFNILANGFWFEKKFFIKIKGRRAHPWWAPVSWHKSERQLADWRFDSVIYNNGSLEQFKATILAEIKGVT